MVWASCLSSNEEEIQSFICVTDLVIQGPRSPYHYLASIPLPAPLVEVLFELPAPVLEPVTPLDPS